MFQHRSGWLRNNGLSPEILDLPPGHPPGRARQGAGRDPAGDWRGEVAGCEDMTMSVIICGDWLSFRQDALDMSSKRMKS